MEKMRVLSIVEEEGEKRINMANLVRTTNIPYTTSFTKKPLHWNHVLLTFYEAFTSELREGLFRKFVAIV